MKLFRQEVLRVLLLDARFRRISTVEISKGTINESLAHPREIFRPVILHGAYAFVLAHNHPSGRDFKAIDNLTLEFDRPNTSMVEVGGEGREKVKENVAVQRPEIPLNPF